MSNATGTERFDAKYFDTLRSFVRGTFDYEFKAVTYLLIAHGTGLVTCLNLLKDYDKTPQLKGLGSFVVLFVIGIPISGIAFAILTSWTELRYRQLALGDDNEEMQHNIKDSL